MPPGFLLAIQHIGLALPLHFQFDLTLRDTTAPFIIPLGALLFSYLFFGRYRSIRNQEFDLGLPPGTL